MVGTKLKSIKSDKLQVKTALAHTLLYKMANSRCHPQSIMFTESLEDMNVHYIYEEEHITSLHKKGGKVEPGNCRPVSLSSLLVKCMESYTRDNIIGHMSAITYFRTTSMGFNPVGPV